MKPLRAKMMRYMERRGYSASTVKTYISWVSQFAQEKAIKLIGMAFRLHQNGAAPG